ncbi:MAG TPA: AAA family ATPase [Bacillales bacterium]|nr:AAA family ATPase [Bacillales bacterium]
MKLRTIDISHYGCFRDWRLTFPGTGLQVVYGLNESGKSTMMRFIYDVLFGFSTKSPGISEAGSDFGGRLTFVTADGETVTFSRNGTKGSGRLTVDLPDGSQSGERTVAKWFPGLDETLFRAIFCFDLDGLQGLERIGSEEMNDYLFHAGMSGDFPIKAIEKQLEKKIEERYKPKGRKPVMNRKLEQLSALERDIREWDKKIGSHDELVSELETLQNRLRQMEEEKAAHRAEIRRLEKRQWLAPFVQEREQCRERLQTLGEVDPFPEDGLPRYEQWNAKAVALQAEAADLETKRDAAKREANAIAVRMDLFRFQADVQREKDEESLMRNKEGVREALRSEVRSEREALAAVLEELGPAWTEDRLAAADTGHEAEQALNGLLGELQEAEQRWRLTEAERERVERQWKESEAERERLRRAKLAEGERERLAAAKTPAGVFGWAGAAALTVAAAVLFFAAGSLLAAAVATAAAAGAAAFAATRAPRGGEMERRLAADERVREECAIAEDRAERLREQREAAVEASEAVRQRKKRLTRQLAAWAERYGFAEESVSEASAAVVFAGVREAKKRMRRACRAEEQLRQVETELQARETKLAKLAEAFGLEGASGSSALYRMIDVLKEEQVAAGRKQAKQEEADQYDRQLTALREKIARYEAECVLLLEQAKAADEDEFRRKAKVHEERRKLAERVAEAEARMKALVPEEAERRRLIADLEERDVDEEREAALLEDELERLTAEEGEVHAETAEKREQVRRLREGGTYEQLRHEYAGREAEFLEEARKWAVHRTALAVLKKTKERYRSRRLPGVLAKAESFFRTMTNGEFEKIYLTDDDGFVVERGDGRRLIPEQLSRGTAEQLYLALRLALAGHYESPSPYPLIVDDVLVNFDHSRTDRAIEVFREAARDHQIVYFTCHRHMLAHFSNNETVSILGGDTVSTSSRSILEDELQRTGKDGH